MTDSISHAGVKGMKWGIRNKSQLSGGSSSGPAQSSDHKKVAKLKSRSVSSLTNKQLKLMNERKRLETEYAKLNPGLKERGMKKAQGVLAVAGMLSAAYAFTQSPLAGKAVNLGKQAYTAWQRGRNPAIGALN